MHMFFRLHGPACIVRIGDVANKPLPHVVIVKVFHGYGQSHGHRHVAHLALHNGPACSTVAHAGEEQGPLYPTCQDGRHALIHDQHKCVS